MKIFKGFEEAAGIKKLVAILRLAVPYTGLILTAREAPDVRREVLQYGVSQIDGGTKLEPAGLIILELTGDQNQRNLLEQDLSAIIRVHVRKMIF